MRPLLTLHRAYFNPRPPRGGRPKPVYVAYKKYLISTHVPREGDDSGTSSACGRHIQFQPTSPARGTTSYPSFLPHMGQFQPTSPARGTTAVLQAHVAGIYNFNPRPPRGGRPPIPVFSHTWGNFNPRPPRGGRRRLAAGMQSYYQISTHVPREGDDPIKLAMLTDTFLFQPTSPARGTTYGGAGTFVVYYISTHVPREGDDTCITS